MDAPESEFVYTFFFHYPLSQKVAVQMLLNFFVILLVFDFIRNFLNITPTALYVKRCIERELLMHHSKAVVGPHVVKTVSSELAGAGA